MGNGERGVQWGKRKDTKNLLVKLTCKGSMSTATTTATKLKQATTRVLEKVIPVELPGQPICDMCMMSTYE